MQDIILSGAGPDRASVLAAHPYSKERKDTIATSATNIKSQNKKYTVGWRTEPHRILEQAGEVASILPSLWKIRLDLKAQCCRDRRVLIPDLQQADTIRNLRDFF